MSVPSLRIVGVRGAFASYAVRMWIPSRTPLDMSQNEDPP